MRFFEHYFKNTSFVGQEEVKVLCPFHDDHSPSASINTKKGLFHCFTCGVGYSEAQFISQVNKIDLVSANKVLAKFSETSQTWDLVQQANLWANNNLLKRVESMGFTRQTIQELKMGAVQDEFGHYFVAYPVLYMGVLMDVRRYNILKIPDVPKVSSNKGAESGFLIPFDIFVKSRDKVYILEGEKDMALARSMGLNAYTLTGGALALPNEYTLPAFVDKDVVICYDNDQAGRDGMKRVGNSIAKIAKSVSLVDISALVREDKEDYYDAMVKYKCTLRDFLDLPQMPFEYDVEQSKTFTKIKKALDENLIERHLITQVIVSAEFSDTYAVPSVAKFEKVEDTDDGNMLKGEVKTWVLDKTHLKAVLELIEVSATQKDVIGKLAKLADVDKKGIKVEVSDYQTVFKTRVIDKGSESDNLSLDLYTFDQLVVGRDYEISYVVYPHPTKHQKLVAVGTKVVEINAYDDFKVDKTLLSELIFNGTVNDKVQKLYESAKHHIAKHLNKDLWFMSDLVFNSILEFDYDGRIRGALDVFILGDTQVGKSETTSKMVDMYNFGHFLSLKTSTTVGLIGGSNKVDGSWLNTIGAIPRQHKRLAVLEEFSGAKPEFIKTMTDIRSSGKLRLARAAGEMNVPCRLRMITISNPVNDIQGNPRFLSTFPNGVQPLMELIKSAEDVARYDGFLLVSKVNNPVNPFSIKLKGTPISLDVYHHKMMWTATRKPEDVIFSDDSDSYIWEKASELNKLFESNFPLFGVTTSQKLARFSVALASLIVSTDESFTKVVVTPEIVDYVVDYMVSIYDNQVFKLKEYKEDYESYTKCSTQDVSYLQAIYPNNSTLFGFLEGTSGTSRANLRAVSGLEGDDFSKIFNALVQWKFVRINGETVYPTNKLRQGLSRINKTMTSDTGRINVRAMDDLVMPRKE